MSPPVSGNKTPESTADAFNAVLRQAGIAETDLTVVSCDKKGACKIQVRQGNQHNEQTLATADKFFDFVNQWLQFNPKAAQNKYPNNSALFKPLGWQWTLVDYNSERGADGILHMGWKKSPQRWWRLHNQAWRFIPSDSSLKQADTQTLAELMQLGRFLEKPTDLEKASQILKRPKPVIKLLEFLASKSWADLGLKQPYDFSKKIYAFDIKKDSSADGCTRSPYSTKPCPQPIFSPFSSQAVTLAGHPDVVIPWSDPYLLMEWQAYLQDAGVRIQRKEGDIASATYYYKSLRVLESARIDDGIRFSLFNPMGAKINELVVKSPSKPEVTVIVTDDPENHYSQITVYGRTLLVNASFPTSFTQDVKEKNLKAIGESLQEIPEVLIAQALDGSDNEIPLRIVAKFRLPEQPIRVRGVYNYKTNVLYLRTRDSDELTGLFYHEIGGHVFDDFSIPFPNKDGGELFLANRDSSALKDYYRWKLAAVFSPSELATYDNLFWINKRHFRDLASDPNDSELGEKFQKTKDALLPFRSKASERFVSDYAIEGRGLEFNMEFPSEFFAEVMAVFLSSMSGRKQWSSPRKREPLLTIVGLNYLFRKYDVSKIGNLEKQDALSFSKKAFKEVLGIDLTHVNEDFAPYAKALGQTQDKVQVSEARKVLSARYRQGIHTNISTGSLWFPGSNPLLKLGVELEYGRRGKVPTSDAVFVPFLRYSALGLSGGISDQLSLGTKLYLEGNTSLELGLDTGNLILDSGVDDPLSVAFGFHGTVRWPLRLFGTDFEVGPTAGVFVRDLGANPFYIGLDVTIP